MSLRVGIVSLGCPRNLVDSESILSRLKEKNITITKLEEADVAIVNTCAFIKEAKEESIDTILDLIELKEKGYIKCQRIYSKLPLLPQVEIRRDRLRDATNEEQAEILMMRFEHEAG